MEQDAITRSIAEGAAIFAAAAPAAKELLVEGAERVELEGGQFLFRQGDPSDGLFVIIAGELEVCLDSKPSWQAPILLGPGDTVGELQVFVGGRRTADVRATRPTSLLRESREVLLRALEVQPGVFDELLELIQARLRRNDLYAALSRLFGQLDEATRSEIDGLLESRCVPRGETVFRQGDEADGMYFVISGRLQVLLSDKHGTESIIGEVARGEFVGEMATLTDGPRSATVRALRESQLVRLSRQAVLDLLDRHPRLLMGLSQTLIERQRRLNSGTAALAEVRTIAVIGLNERVPVETVARRLARKLGRYAPSIFVDHLLADEALGLDGVIDISAGHSHDLRITTWLAEQEASHTHVVFFAGHEWTPWAQRCVQGADKLLLVASADHDPAPGELEAALSRALGEGPALPTGLVLLHPDATRMPSGTARWLEPRALERHYHVRLGHPADCGRLARMVTGRALGVALGGGGARGGALIGVLRALRAQGVAIDAIGGTSAGAGIAALYAMGLDDEEIMARCVDGFVKSNPFRSLTLPLMSLVDRRKMDQQARKMFGDLQIEDLWTDHFCVASNLTTGKAEIMRRGPLWKAVRASTSLPGVAVPVIHEGCLLVDGGVMDNLPGRVMRKLVGGRVVVVDISPDERTAYNYDYDYEDLPSPWKVLWSKIHPLRKSFRPPSIARVIMRTVAVGSLAERANSLMDADLSLFPPVSRYGMFDFSAIEEMANDAEAYTMEVLNETGFRGPAPPDEDRSGDKRDA